MNRLILFRHGKAEQDSASGRDFDRPLAPRGAVEAAAAGATLAELGFAPDLALVSPSARTRQTWAALAPAFPKARVEMIEGLYHADVAALRRAIGSAPDAAGAVMIVGHNPGLQDLVAEMLTEGGADAALIARTRADFPTAAAAVLRLDREGAPQCEGLFFPRDRRGV